MTKTVIALTLAITCFSFSAQAAPAIALWGTPKYKPGFTHFDYVNPEAPKGGTIKLSANASFDSVNPFILRGIPAPGITGYLFQPLMVQSYDEPQSYYGLIAQSVELAPDRSYADFTLNPNARWHDGQPITADDVIFSLTILKEKGHPLYKVLYKPITAEKRDAQCVRFHFADKTHRELPLIAASLPVLPKHYYDTVPFDKTTLAPPLGSGPYKIQSINPGRAITYVRVKDYWAADLPTQKGLNNFDIVHFDVYRDDVVALEGIKSHQFDFYEEFIARNWATAYDIPAVTSGQLIKQRIPHKIPRGMQGFLFNTRLPKFSDRRVREAIGLTLDFEWMNKTLFYGAYERNSSYFNNTDFEAKGLPSPAELALLAPYRATRKPSPPAGEGWVRGEEVGHNGAKLSVPSSQPSPARGEGATEQAASSLPTTYSLPPSLFTTPYIVPTTDGSGFARNNLIRAQTLLNDAGWVMKNGTRINAKTGEPLTIEFLMTQRTFERVIAVMRHNLQKLGIASSFRYVDASQYQKRVDHRDFDIVSIWWNQGLFYPGSEQYMYWHSSQAEVEGSQNLAGVKNNAVDMLTEKIQRAQSLADLTPAARALDRVLLQEHYVIPHWNLTAWRVLYWNQFAHPKITPAYNIAVDSWWQLPANETAQPVTMEESQ